MQISFHGAADTVTGSRHLVRMGGRSILLDCGLFQGFKVLRERNWLAPPPELIEADAVVLSHAHLDHSGWLPALVKHGFRGRIYASPATRDLAEVLLLDSAQVPADELHVRPFRRGRRRPRHRNRSRCPWDAPGSGV